MCYLIDQPYDFYFFVVYIPMIFRNLLHFLFFYFCGKSIFLFNNKKVFTHRILASFRASSTMEPGRQTHPWQRSALPAADPITILCTQNPCLAHKSVHTSSPGPSAIREDVPDLSMVDNPAAGRRMAPVEVEAICNLYERRRR